VFALSPGGVLTLEAAAHGRAITKLALYEPPVVVDDNDRRASQALSPTNSDCPPSLLNWRAIAAL
jgi:hypothetical protein